VTRKIDLDAARKARAETNGEPIEISFGGESFELPPEAPWEMVRASMRGDSDGALEALLGPGGYERLRTLSPSFKDIEALMDEVTKEYGLGEAQGEPAASDSS
jgi:hypothetical protein